MEIPRYVLDASAIEASFYAEGDIEDLITDADAGLVHLYLPTVAIAEVESRLHAGVDGWSHLLYTTHVDAMVLSQHAAIEVGAWPGPLEVRHAAHEARALAATVVTRHRGLYAGLRVAVRVV